jgi:hypothetical protein
MSIVSRDSHSCPLAGGYYWIPSPRLRSFDWDLLSCHDLACDEDQSHYDIWPKVLSHLAELWGRDPKVLRRHLIKHCYGLPRGRVTHPEKTFLLLHGDDSPVSDWKPRVIRRFDLQGQRIRTLFDEHEQTLPGDLKAVQRVFGWNKVGTEAEHRSADP